MHQAPRDIRIKNNLVPSSLLLTAKHFDQP